MNEVFKVKNFIFFVVIFAIFLLPSPLSVLANGEYDFFDASFPFFVLWFSVCGFLYCIRVACICPEDYSGVIFLFAFFLFALWPLGILFEIEDARSRIPPRKDEENH